MTVDVAELEWSIRDSFVAYLDALPDGLITVRDGARRDRDSFHLTGGRDGDGYAFGGTIHFGGHLGVLDVTIDGLQVRSDQVRTVVRTVVAGEPVELATTLEPLSQNSSPTLLRELQLTADGAALLGGVYSPGAALAPLTICTAPAAQDH